MENGYGTFGKQLAVDLWDIEPEIIDNFEYMIATCKLAALKSGATIIGEIMHKFHPQGLTIIIGLSESHLAIHTAPEHGFAAFDIYTCGNTCDPEKALDYMVQVLKPKKIHRQKLFRGIR